MIIFSDIYVLTFYTKNKTFGKSLARINLLIINGRIKMATYKVVKHPTLGFEEIKQGFNIFAFLFSFIWAVIKGL
jgi:hypothetical protein